MMLNAILIVGVMVVIANLLVSREFQGYIKANDLERFEIVKESLQEYYSMNGNWDGLISGPGSLGVILNRSMMMDRQYRQPAIQSPRRRNYLKQRFFFPRERGRKRERPFSTPPPFPDPSSLNLLPNAPKGPGDYFMQRVVVFDNNKNLLMGRLQSHPPEFMEELFHQGSLLGRIGLYPPEMLPHPRDELFLKTKSTIFWVLAIMMGLMATIISLGLSWYLLKPVKKLTEGTQALARREFEARVEIESRDELGQLAEDFNHMAETLESFENQRRQWLSDISHELGTPLSVLRGEIEAIQDGVREMTPERLESLHDEVMQLNRIVEDLKLINRAEAGALELRKEEFSAVELLSRTASSFQTRFETHQIQVTRDFGQTLDIMIQADPDRIRQVFENLMENVIRHGDGPAILSLSARKANSQLELSLCDNGPGVDPKMLPHLFDRFFRADESRSRVSGGSGLGLAICKNLVEAHGGQIEAQENRPRGLCIRLTLPLIQKEAS
jgi:two-component system sensor histidine kinase BaeS